MADAGITTIIYTDISKDGMLAGPNVAATAEMVRVTGVDVIASGGITSIDDLRAVYAAGCSGAIIGKAVYAGVLDLSMVLKEFS
jgi:phosphoribosylformimino-5-aminoimidazole carboxamide ribotide isomerase